MESFLEAAFVAKTMIDPGSFPEGVTPKALANSTAHQCIREADGMGNGKLSLEVSGWVAVTCVVPRLQAAAAAGISGVV